jgi:hypothetical protein
MRKAEEKLIYKSGIIGFIENVDFASNNERCRS